MSTQQKPPKSGGGKSAIAVHREAKGFNQSELARAVGVTPQAVQKWESGASMPRPPKISEIARVLGVSSDALMTALYNPDGTARDPETARTASKQLVQGAALRERIRMVLDQTGTDIISLASAAQVPADQVEEWLAGRSAPMDVRHAMGIQAKYGYNPVWLVTGKGDPKMAQPHGDEYRPEPIAADRFRNIPVVAMAQLGDNGHFCDLEYPVGHGDGYLRFISNDPDAYGLRCAGESMEPRIREGEFVVIAPNHPVQNGDEVLVKSKDGRVMVKILGFTRDGYTTLLSVNQAHKPIKIPAGDIEKVSFVEAIVKPSAWRPD